jgi:hypothetical protein
MKHEPASRVWGLLPGETGRSPLQRVWAAVPGQADRPTPLALLEEALEDSNATNSSTDPTPRSQPTP